MILKRPLHPKPFHGSMMITTAYPHPTWSILESDLGKKKKKFQATAAERVCEGQAGLVGSSGSLGEGRGKILNRRSRNERRKKGGEGGGREETTNDSSFSTKKPRCQEQH